MTPLLFSYGTLQKESVQRQLFGRLLHGTKEALTGYKLAPIQITDEAFLAKGEATQQQTIVHTGDAIDIIEGIAFELTDDELQHADKYEPSNYRRIQVKLQSGKQAWIYTAVE